MYIHLREDLVVRAKDIITIIDKESVNSSPIVKELLDFHKVDIIHLKKESFKSLVITEKEIHFSEKSSRALKKRTTNLKVVE